MRVLVVTGTRADFGLWRPVIAEFERRRQPDLDLRLLVTGMHLDPRFGSTVDEVRASGYRIEAEIAGVAAGDTKAEMAASLGEMVSAMAPVIERAAPDWLLLLGDRGEQLAAALVVLHRGSAIAHLHGGERTLGAVDDTIRDLITRMAHLHLVSDPSAADRLTRMGEAAWRIQVTGAPGLDDLVHDVPSAAEARERLGIGEQPYAVVLYHPETVGQTDPAQAVKTILEGVADAGLAIVAILPNADAGGRAIRHELLARAPSLLRVAASVPRRDYLCLLSGAAVLVGNSSSGLIEAPILRLPVVNVGDRQRGRLRGDNIIDVPADRQAIRRAVTSALDVSFRSRLSGVSPYGSGDAARRIVDRLLDQRIDQRLLVKTVA